MNALSTHDPITGYRPLQDSHDELMLAGGSVRDHWSGLVATYQTLGSGELTRRQHEVQRLLEQGGVTYNLADEHHGRSRPWKLDAIPFVVPSAEWAQVERGVIQRAELLNLVLTDLYGERRLLRTGIIPPEMILADPQFLRACDDIMVPGDKQLVVLGTDIARAADGAWVALGHRAQAPSGAAYALENRRVLSRVFPDAFRHSEVQPLSPFVQALRSALQNAAPPGVDDPSIVILSPGSRSETAFEHASIAAQLGYPLVQGSDLELRQGQVGLRTIGGWVPVHVVLRRVDAGFCDPLALRSDSTLGIPGLVDACRAGTVSVVNTLGSGILENAGLAGLMPELSRHLLGSDLLLDSVPSWWCGDPAGRSHVLANLGSFVVRPLSRLLLQHSIDTTQASVSELDDLRRRILAQPAQWVGQDRLDPGSSPVLHADRLKPRATVLRSFAVACAESYVAMAGGLARIALSDSNAPITNRAGAASKDIWVLGHGSDSRVDVRPFDGEAPTRTSIGSLAPRAAEHLFWLGRYAERAEATVRLIRTTATRCDEFLNTAAGPGSAALHVVLETLTRTTGTFPGFVRDDAKALFQEPTGELFSLVIDEARPGTVAHAVSHMFDALEAVRDQLSVDTWLVVGSLQRELEGLVDGGSAGAADRDEAMAVVLNKLLHGLLSLSGLANESMVRDLGWHFMEAGRRIERGIHVVTLVRAALGTQRSAPVESLVVESVMSASESIITSRRRYRSPAVAATTVELLFDDGTNPRSLRFQIDRLADSLALIGAPTGSLSSAQRLLDELNELLKSTNAAQLAQIDELGQRPDLERFASAVRANLSTISDTIAAASFTRLQVQHSMRGPIEHERRLDTVSAAT